MIEIDSDDIDSMNVAMKEVLHLKNQRHRNIIQYHDCFMAKTSTSFLETTFLCLVMEYVNSGTINEIIKLDEDVNEDFILSLIYQISQGLSFLQSDCELIHRDISPRNIMLQEVRSESHEEEEEEEGEGEKEEKKVDPLYMMECTNPYSEIIFKLVDFGFVRHEESVKKSTTLCGTRCYIAPEIMRKKKYSYNVDVYSLGCIIVELMMKKEVNVYMSYLEHQGEEWIEEELRKRSKVYEYSDDLVDLTLNMIKTDPIQRMCSHEVKEAAFEAIQKRQFLILNSNSTNDTSVSSSSSSLQTRSRSEKRLREVSIFEKLPFRVLLKVTQEYFILHILSSSSNNDDDDNDESEVSITNKQTHFPLTDYFGYFSEDVTRTIWCIFPNLQSTWDEEDVLEEFAYFSNNLPTRYLTYWNYSGVRNLSFSPDFYKRARRIRALMGVMMNHDLLRILPSQIRHLRFKIDPSCVLDDEMMAILTTTYKDLRHLEVGFQDEEPTCTVDYISTVLEEITFHNNLPKSITFSQCKNLSKISIWYTNISNEHIQGICQNGNGILKEINFRKCTIEDSFYMLFEKQGVEKIDLSMCRVDVEKFEMVKKPCLSLKEIVLSSIRDIPNKFFEVIVKKSGVWNIRLEFCGINDGFLKIFLEEGLVLERKVVVYIRYMDRRTLDSDLFSDIRCVKNVSILC